MRMQTLAVAAAFTLACSVAFAQDVKVDFDKDANFGAIKTFAVEVGTSWGNPLSEKRVVAEIEQALTEKGWTKADPGGKSLNILSEAFASFFAFFSGLSEISSEAVPRNRSCFDLVSKMSTTRVPTVYSDTVVCAVPVPKPR